MTCGFRWNVRSAARSLSLRGGTAVPRARSTWQRSHNFGIRAERKQPPVFRGRCRWLLPVPLQGLRALTDLASCVGRLAVLKGWESLNGLPSFVLSQSQLVEALQIEPELCARSEEMSKAQGCVTGDSALAVQNSCDAVGRHFELTGKLGKIFERQGGLSLIS